MSDRFERNVRIDASGERGLISGVLATDGEASDGHILSIKGGSLAEGAPLLWGHDDRSAEGTLGKWTGLSKGQREGLNIIRGSAQIEMGGEGELAARRRDIANLIDKGHVSQFSIRWTADSAVPRSSLEEDHPAYSEKEGDFWSGPPLFFESWRMLEGSVVPIGADPAALIGRAAASPNQQTRQFWRDALLDSIRNDGDDSNIVGVALPGDETAYVERRVYEAMLEDANSRLNRALDILEVAACVRDYERVAAEPDAMPQRDEEPAAPPVVSHRTQPMDPERFVGLMENVIQKSDERSAKRFESVISRAIGKR